MPKEINISDKKDITKKSKGSTKEPDKQKETTKKGKTVKSNKKVVIISLSIAILILTSIALFFYFEIYKTKEYKNPNEIINLANGYIVSTATNPQIDSIPTPLPSQPKTEESPINGLLFTKEEMEQLKTRRPVAVMINNHVQARPQSGLSSADIVYEALAESGITRHLAIFWSTAPDKVGPIRSARQYYLEWLSPYDPLYIYDGCAKTTNPKTNACGNVYTYKIKIIGTLGAWRWNDGTRYAPHNEYSSLEKAWDYAKTKKWNNMPNIESWEFKKEATSAERGQKTKVKVTFYEKLNNNGMYDVIWTYDSRTNSYLRTIGGKIDIDQETDTQVSAKNVVIQEITMTPAYDDKARIIQDTIDKGKATYLIDGKITTGNWEKTSRTDRTSYYDSNGDEIEFNRGKVWISVIPRSLGKFAIIEQ
jgi:hypothetical protein